MSDFSDDEIDYGRCQALPVAEFDEYDASLPPTSGADYLRRVQLEAQKCPQVVVSSIDPSKFTSRQTRNINENAGFKKLSPELVPPLEWQLKVVADFSKLRVKVATFKSRINDDQVSRNLPKHTDVHWWRSYCLGTDKTNAELSANADNIEANAGHEPLLRDLCSLSHHQTHKLLNYFITWIDQLGFSDQAGKWIYALLACLEKPLSSDVHATLRDLSRTCSQSRSTLSSEDARMQSLNLIICLIGRYFNQLDLVDE